MTKYDVTYAFDVPAYGHACVEAANDEEAIAEVKRRFKEDTLIDTWHTEPDCGCSNHRIVDILDEDSRDEISAGFSLEETEDE